MLTCKQEAFAKAIAEGIPQGKAAALAGYGSGSDGGLRSAATRLMRHPGIQQAAHARREKLIQGDLADKALRTLAGIMDDEAAPAAARVQACRFVLESAGHGIESRRLALKEVDSDDKPLSQRSVAELEEFVSRQQAVLDGFRSVSAQTMSADTSLVVDSEVVA